MESVRAGTRTLHLRSGRFELVLSQVPKSEGPGAPGNRRSFDFALLFASRFAQDDKSAQGLDLDAEDGGEVVDDGGPIVAAVGRTIDLTASGTEVDAAVIERVDGHGIAQHVHIAILLGKAVGECFPLIATGARAIDLQLAFKRKVLGVALDGHDVDRFGLVEVDVDDEAEVGGKVAADLGPVVASVVGAHHVPVFLHEENAGALGIHSDVMDAVAGFSSWVGNVFGVETLVDGLPRFAAVVAAEGTGGGDRDVDSVGIRWIEDDRVKAHAASARLPLGPGAVTAEAREFVPTDAAIGGAEEGRVFDASVDGVGVGEGGLQVPDAFELNQNSLC